MKTKLSNLIQITKVSLIYFTSEEKLVHSKETQF